MTVRLVPLQYDIKTSRAHLKRVLDLITYPPTLRFLENEKLVNVVDKCGSSHEASGENNLRDKIDGDLDNSMASIANDSNLEIEDEIKECNENEKVTMTEMTHLGKKKVLNEVSSHYEKSEEVKGYIFPSHDYIFLIDFILYLCRSGWSVSV
jgi:hypothetical protein